jgi:hypothetical protein
LRLTGILSAGRHIVYSTDLNILLKLATILVEELKPRAVYVVAEGGVLGLLAGIIGEAGGWVFLAEDVEEAGGPGDSVVICINKPCFTTPSSSVIVLTTERVRAPGSFTRHYLRRLDWGVYAFETPGEAGRVVLTVRGSRVVEGTGLTPVEEKALDLVRNAMLEYGELKVGDAVFIIERELGVSRDAARRIFSKLVSLKYLRVRGGAVELA